MSFDDSLKKYENFIFSMENMNVKEKIKNINRKEYFDNGKGIIIPFTAVVKIDYSPKDFIWVCTVLDVEYDSFPIEQLDDYLFWLDKKKILS